MHFYKFIIHNTEYTHYNFSYKSWSTIDLVITSAQFINRLHVFYHSDLAGSDHTPMVTFDTTQRTTHNCQTTTHWTIIKRLKGIFNTEYRLIYIQSSSTRSNLDMF